MPNTTTPFVDGHKATSAASIDNYTRYITTDLDTNVKYLEELLGVGKSFDILSQPYTFGGRRIHVFLVNGFYDARTVMQMLAELAVLNDGALDEDALDKITHRRITLPSFSVVNTLDEFVTNVLSGPIGILIEGVSRGLIIDTRVYPARLPNVPETEKVVLGPHDGFVETLLYNTTLLRRRLRDPRLRCEIVRVGRHSHTDVALCYLEGVADPRMVEDVRRRLKDADVRNISMSERAVATLLSDHPWNPLPTVRFTERADMAAAQVAEGRILVVVDTTPQAIIVPAPFFAHVPHPEDFHIGAPAGTYLRWVILMATIMSIFLPALWLLAATEPSLLPKSLTFIGPRQPPTGMSLATQFIVAELGIEVVRRAILNTPSSVAAAMSIFGAVILGDALFKTGLFLPEVILYLGVATVFTFAISSVEMMIVARLFRISLLLSVALFKLPGLVLATLAFFVLALATRSLGVPYLWPLVPFNWSAFKSIFIVSPVTSDMASSGPVTRPGTPS